MSCPPTPANLEAPDTKRLLAAAVAVSLSCGVLFGMLDAMLADAVLPEPRGVLGYLGNYSAAVMSYCGLLLLSLLPASLICRRALRSLPLTRLLTLTLTLGLFAEFYWRSCPYVFPGEAPTSPQRLLALFAQLALAYVVARLVGKKILKLPRMAHVAIRLYAFLCILGGLLYVIAQQAHGQQRGQLNDRNRELPNILLVVAEGLRADQLGCYGNQEAQTPNIDALAQSGVLFEDCTASLTNTTARLRSILTGQHPDADTTSPPGSRVTARPSATLPELLNGAELPGFTQSLLAGDYNTAIFRDNALPGTWGLELGFDGDTGAMLGTDLVYAESQWSLFRSELLPWKIKNESARRVDPTALVNTASEWLGRQQGRRWMAMVLVHSKLKSPASRAVDSDGQVGELLLELGRLDMLANTLVVVTSIHRGGPDGWSEGNAVLSSKKGGSQVQSQSPQPTVQVPMIFSGPTQLARGRRINRVAQPIDLIPTICDLLMLAPSVIIDGGLFDGVSQAPRMLSTGAGL